MTKKGRQLFGIPEFAAPSEKNNPAVARDCCWWHSP